MNTTTVARLVSLSLDVTNNIYCGRPGHHKNHRRRHHHHHRPRPRPPPPPSSSSFSPSSPPPSSSSLSPHGHRHRHCDCHHNHHYLVFMLTILNFLVMTMMMAIVVMALIIAMTTMDYDDDDVGLVVMMANMVRVVFLVASWFCASFCCAGRCLPGLPPPQNHRLSLPVRGWWRCRKTNFCSLVRRGYQKTGPLNKPSWCTWYCISHVGATLTGRCMCFVEVIHNDFTYVHIWFQVMELMVISWVVWIDIIFEFVHDWFWCCCAGFANTKHSVTVVSPGSVGRSLVGSTSSTRAFVLWRCLEVRMPGDGLNMAVRFQEYVFVINSNRSENHWRR